MGCGSSNEKASPQKEAAPAAAPKSHLLLPQNDTVDARRTRAAQIDHAKIVYAYGFDIPGTPPYAKTLESQEQELNGHGLKELLKVGILLEYAQADQWANYVDGKVKKFIGRRDKADKKDPFYEFNALYDDDERPAVAKVWQTDEEFGRQRIAGLVPWTIKLAKLSEHDFPVTDAILGNLTKGKTLASLEAAGKLFITSHDVLEGVPTKPGVHLAAPIVLFWLSDENKLLPLAIQLGQKSSPTTPIFTPNDLPNVWLAAKIHASYADITIHSVYYHAVEMHMLAETVWVSCCRNLAEVHPLRAMIKPHFFNTVTVNAGVRMTLGPDGSLSSVFGTGHQGNLMLMAKVYKKFNFSVDMVPPVLFASRKVDTLPAYYYKDDTLAAWKITTKYVQSMIDLWYAKDKDVVDDYELQAWMADLGDPVAGAVPGLPVDLISGRMMTKAQLVVFLTANLYNVTSRHSYVENAGLQYWGYAPLNPCSFRLPIPTSKADIPLAEIINGLPDEQARIMQTALSESVDTHNPDFMLGNLPNDYLKDVPDSVKHIDAFKRDLNLLKDEIDKRNKAPGAVPCNYMNPTSVFVSIVH